MIHWPERYDPARTPVHVRNEFDTRAAPALVWAWLVRAAMGPSWYPNSRDVRLDGGSSVDLSLARSFTWRTFGVSIRSTVLEDAPPEHIAWNALGLGVDAYHAWLITPTLTGSHLLTEETQCGWALASETACFRPGCPGSISYGASA
jgi:hypothetical protein